ncbi:MAG: glycosyltransferase [Holophagae bacterium]|nr:glycosyltransferase [Holophagae bacterium]
MTRIDGIHLPEISIIVITKDEEQNIRPCLNTLITADYPADLFEIIVVDASTDRTPAIIAEYKSVRLIKSTAGFSRQRNEGLKTARFDIIAFVDADTIVPTSWLKAIVTGFKEHPDADGIGGDAFPPPGTTWLGCCIAAVGHPGGGSIGLDANTPIGIDGITFIPGCNGAFYKSALEAVGGYDLNFDSGGEDIDISRRLRAADFRLDYERGMTIFHKPHGPLLKYAKWNIGVGVTKYSLNEAGPMNMIREPGSPVWVIFGLALLVFGLVVHPLIAVASMIGAHLVLQLILRIWSRPYGLLLQRRRHVGLDRLSIWIVVPILVYIRQFFMNIGMWKQWRGRFAARDE